MSAALSVSRISNFPISRYTDELISLFGEALCQRLFECR
jgi:hypothetical protein